jgi:peptidyl-prolyl cis-trans isomerase B (cyclophilin B)
MSNTRRPRNPQLSQPQNSTTTAIVIGLVVALCIGAIVVLSVILRGGDSDNTASPGGSTGTETAPTTPGDTAATTAASTPPSSSPSTGPIKSCTAVPPVPASPQQFDAPPDKELAKDTTWVATMKTNCGPITLELDGAAAPQTVSSFLFLANKGFYDDVPCHRLVTTGIFVLQCGDPTGSGSGGPGYGYGIENAPEDGKYPRGTLAMARTSDPQSNGSQFFMVYKETDLPTDGGGYSIFGKVTQGLDILEAIAKEGVAADGIAPVQPVSILSLSVTEKK